MRPAYLYHILDQEFLSTSEGHHTPVMLWGPPGVGKPQIVAQVAAAHQTPMIDIRLSQMEPSDLRGIPFRVENRVEWAVPAILPGAERHGAWGILFLDEITSAPPAVSAAAYHLILDRRLGSIGHPTIGPFSPPATGRGTAAELTPCRHRWLTAFPTSRWRPTWMIGWLGPMGTESTSASSPFCASARSFCSISTRPTIRWPFRPRAPGSSPIVVCKSSRITWSCCGAPCRPASDRRRASSSTPL